MTILVNFLNERSPLTIGTVLVAFNSVCPDRLDLLHPHYRRLCRLLPDADEWGQITIVNVLVRYARRMLPKPLVFQDHNGATVERIDSDLQLLFRSAESLFFSRNPAVVLAVSRALYYLGPPSDTPKIVPPLLKLLRTSTEIERVVVEELYIIARASPELLSSHYSRLFLRSSDLPSTKLAKLRILVKLMKSENASALLGEFTEYVHDRDDSVAAAAVDAIGTCARLLPEYTSRCIDILIRLMKDGIDAVGSSAVRVLKDLVQSNRRETVPHAAATAAVVAVEGIASVQTPAEIVASLAHQFDDVRHPRAKACVLWLVGQYAAASISTTATTATAKDGVQAQAQIQVVPGVENWAPDVLRRAVKSFAHDDKAVKLQTLTLTAKLLSLSPESEILGKLSLYCFSLARYDQSYDVRDRGRLLCTLLADICPKLKTVSSSGNNNHQNPIQEQEWNEETTDGGGDSSRGMITLRKEQIQMILFQGKEPSEEEPDPVDPTMTLGSMAL
ncbi:AP-3 complex subunit beta, partial [Serendipita sp. 407]